MTISITMSVENKWYRLARWPTKVGVDGRLNPIQKLIHHQTSARIHPGTTGFVPVFKFLRAFHAILACRIHNVLIYHGSESFREVSFLLIV